MSYDFTDRTRKVLAMTREEAIRLQHDHVDTEHILLGLIRERDGVAVSVLTRLSLNLEQVRERVEAAVGRGNAKVALGKLPYTSSAKNVLGLAMAEARELNHSFVGPEHLLLGLLREERGIAARVLEEEGVTLDAARPEVLRHLELNPPARTEAGPTRGGWLCRLLGGEMDGPSNGTAFPIGIDDASSLSIYEQIVADGAPACRGTGHCAGHGRAGL
jgi:ATP-dependent Clp protease ATP-binding subunit ClpC